MSKPPKTFRDMVIALLKSSGEHHRPPPIPLAYHNHINRNRHHLKAIFPEPETPALNVKEPADQNHHHHHHNIDMNQLAPKKPYHNHQHHQDPKKPYPNHQNHIDMHQLDHKEPYHNHQHHIDMHQDPKKLPGQKHQFHVNMPKDPKKPYMPKHQQPYQKHQQHQFDVNLEAKKQPYSRSSSSSSTGSHRHLASVCAFCLWALLFLLLTSTFLAVTGAILYLWLEPRAPDFRVAHLNMTSSADVRFESWNRNGALGFAYGPVRVEVYALGKEGVVLGRATAPGFVQAPHSVAVVGARAAAAEAAVTPEGRMVEVRAECHVAVDVGGWDAGVYPIKVVCSGLEVGMVESESDSGCDVYLYSWILIRGHERK